MLERLTANIASNPMAWILAALLAALLVFALYGSYQTGMIDWPGWVTALAAVVALVFGVVQVLSAKESQHEATAKEIWMNYEFRGLEYPKFANPELSDLDYENETLDGDKEKFFEYQWFVSFMLLACDQVLQLRGGADWERIVENNIRYHRDYIQSKAFAPSLEVLSPLLRSKITQVQSEKNGEGN